MVKTNPHIYMIDRKCKTLMCMWVTRQSQHETYHHVCDSVERHIDEVTSEIQIHKIQTRKKDM